MNQSLLPLFFALAVLSARGATAQPVHPWEVVEKTFTAREETANPYREVAPEAGHDRLRVAFTGTSGEARGQRLTVSGFWDGGRTWRVRFAPPAAGTWSYASTSPDDGLDGVTGTVEVVPWSAAERAANPVRHGFVRVRHEAPNAGRFFAYADGTPFLWVGDTWWNWTHRGIRFETFRRLVDDRARKGFTLGQLFVAGNGWGRESSLLDATYTVLDVAHMQHVDSLVAYANARGLTVWVHAWWSREGIDRSIGADNLKRWWRYLIHRLGAYNVVWVLAGEYNMNDYGGLGLAFWNELGALVSAEDPYDRLVGVHNTPPGWEGGDGAPQWSTGEVLHDASWLDYNQSQVGHGRWRNERIPDVVAADYARMPPKPVVVTEPWYEFVEGNPTAADIRFGAWSALLSGAAGHTYGGGHVWRAHVPEAPAGRGAWPLEEGFERTTLDYPGAVSMRHLAAFFRDLAWWRLAPHPELLRDYADPYCAAVPGEEYVAYLRWGGGVQVDLRPSAATDVFEARWFDPAHGGARPGPTLSGGDVRYVAPPEDYPGTEQFRDWVLHVRRRP
jgi:hypothetical protein